MEPQVLDSLALRSFLASVGGEHELVGPVAREGGVHSFQVVEDPGDIDLHYVHTVLPPKKYFLPPRETLLRYTVGDAGSGTVVNEVRPRVIVGVHPCDLTGIRHLDLSFAGTGDVNYRAKRAAALLIGVDCLPDEYCFCGSVGTLRPREGFDLFLLDLGEQWMIVSGTARGEELLLRHAGGLRPAGDGDLQAREAHYRKKASMQKARLHADAFDLPLIFEGATRSEVWEKTAARCLSCGTCTNVCPTCYCFDIQDEVEADLSSGSRVRIWDSCLLKEFTAVAGGEVFRDRLSRRLRHRVYRKFHYLQSRYNEPNCTGCGRCGRECPADIRIDHIVNDLVAAVMARAGGGGE